MEKSVESQLNRLFESRYHGAVNIAGIKYQLTYSIFRAFDLYKPGAITSVQLEGIEDVDVGGQRKITLNGLRLSRQYVQVKTSKGAWDWNRFTNSKILENFLPVWSAEPTAELLIVSNFAYKGRLAELAKFCTGELAIISNKVRNNIVILCERAGYQDIDLTKLLRQISFQRISDEELLLKVSSAIVRWFELTTPNTDLYFLVLMAKFIDLATRRSEVVLQDLESIRLSIQEQIEMGTSNPAIQNGWLERLKFVEEDHPLDYYEGKNARPGHILAGLDVRRHEWEDRIHEAITRSRVCIVRASSGQGKSTLLYRYAYEHYHPETTFVVKQLGEESMVTSIKQAIVARQRLGLPIMVLIDNLRANLRFWHRLVAEFSGHEIFFLVTVREEDWHRYLGSASGIVWEVVTPTLSLEEARNIYAVFKERDRVAEGVLSAEWAFEQVADRKLLIEFVYLITHGQMLADRLKEQVESMHQLREDRAKVQVLRLVSVAQTYDSKITIEGILDCVHFEDDPDSTLKSLEREYLMFVEGVCEGLHLVRSQHLIPVLHSVLPLQRTISDLIEILDTDNLESFIAGVFSDPKVDHTPALKALIERCQKESLDTINRMAKALFAASEASYYRQHRSLFDTAFDKIGGPGIFLLCSATLPSQTINPLEDLKKSFGEDHPNLKLLSSLAKQFNPRGWNERYEVRFLKSIIDNITADDLGTSFSQIGTLLGWAQLTGLDASGLVQVIAARDWREQIYHADLNSVANFLDALHAYSRGSYNELVASEKIALISYFKLTSDTLWVEERNGDIYIEFIVDEGEESISPNEQAVKRLRNLQRFFPDYRHYCSQGLYASIFGLQPPVDDTCKAMPKEAFTLEIGADRNAEFLSIVDSYYSTQSIYEWQEQWFNLRRDLLDLIKKCIDYYECLFRRKRADSSGLGTALTGIALRFLYLKKLPVSLRKRFQREQAALDKWEASLNNFSNQFSNHDPMDASQQSSHLMRHNLTEAIDIMPNVHQAFQSIISKTQPYFDLYGLDEREKATYRYFSEILDFWFELPSRRVQSLRRAIEQRQQGKRKQFVDSVRSTIAPLEEKGFKFLYPNGPFLEHPLENLVLGFEVLDFEKATEHMVLIILQLATFPLQCHFVYLVPLLKTSCYSQSVWRIGFDNIRDISKNKMEGKEWALLPVDPPHGLFEVLPEVQHSSFSEFHIVFEFYRIIGVMNSIRNAYYFLKHRLNFNHPFELQLAQKHRSLLLNEIKEISAETAALRDQMLEFGEDNPAASEWRQFCAYCFQRITDFQDIESVDPETFHPVNVFQDDELQVLFGRYLNERYLPGSSVRIR